MLKIGNFGGMVFIIFVPQGGYYFFGKLNEKYPSFENKFKNFYHSSQQNNPHDYQPTSFQHLVIPVGQLTLFEGSLVSVKDKVNAGMDNPYYVHCSPEYFFQLRINAFDRSKEIDGSVNDDEEVDKKEAKRSAKQHQSRNTKV